MLDARWSNDRTPGSLRGKIHISDAEPGTPDWLIDAFEGTFE
jgi:hypothetical protein